MPRDLGALAHWHLNYETVECHPAATFRVTKMKFAKSKDPATGKGINNKTTVIYSAFITLKNIPLQACDYVVNGKPALEWVMERQEGAAPPLKSMSQCNAFGDCLTGTRRPPSSFSRTSLHCRHPPTSFHERAHEHLPVGRLD